jgi:hypothetical protein
VLTQDRALAEDLVQTALAKTWFAWSRIDGDPGRCEEWRAPPNAASASAVASWQGFAPRSRVQQLVNGDVVSVNTGGGQATDLLHGDGARTLGLREQDDDERARGS